MRYPMRLTTQQIRQITNILLQYLKEREYSLIQFADKDSWYLKIWHKSRDLKKDPPLALGFLDEDIEALQKLHETPIPSSYELERLGIILATFGAVLSDKMSCVDRESGGDIESHFRKFTTTEIRQIMDPKDPKIGAKDSRLTLTITEIAQIMDFLLGSMESMG